MGGVADLVEGVNQGTLQVGLECNVEVDGGAGGRVAQTLPVRWNSIPAVLDAHIIPRYEGRREVGKGRGSEEGERREPVVSHEYRRSATKMPVVSAIQRNCAIQNTRGPHWQRAPGLSSTEYRNAEYLAEMDLLFRQPPSPKPRHSATGLVGTRVLLLYPISQNTYNLLDGRVL